MSRPWWIDPGPYAWEHVADQASVVLGSSYPARVDTSKDDPDYRPRPAGFTAHLEQEDQDRQGETEHPLDVAHAAAKAALDTLDAAILCDHDGTDHDYDRDTGCPALRCGLCGDVAPYHFRSCPSQQRRTA